MSCKGTTHAYLYLSQLREDAPIGTDLPVWLTTAANYNDSIPLLNQVIEWGPLTDSWDGFVLLVDDVQRYAGPALNYSLAALNASLPHFFRLAVIIFCLFFPNRRLNIFYSIHHKAPRATLPWQLRCGRMAHGWTLFQDLHNLVG